MHVPIFDVVARPGGQEDGHRAEPRSFVDELAHLPEARLAKIMGGNMARLIGVPAEVPA